LIGIITFIALVLVLLVSEFSTALQEWRHSLASQVTVEVLPLARLGVAKSETESAQVAQIMQALENFTGVVKVERVARAQIDAWLEPWLGAGNVIDDLPLPTLLAVERQPDVPFDFEALRKTVQAISPGARVEDHRTWYGKLLEAANVLRHLLQVLMLMMFGAAVLTVALTVHQALIVHRDILAILSLIGAHPGYIARQFQFHTLGLAAKGVTVGGAAFILCLVLLQVMLPEGIVGFMPGGLGVHHIVLVTLIVPFAVVLTVATATRLTVFYILRKQAYFAI
jgi:cell division transport system permease protein